MELPTALHALSGKISRNKGYQLKCPVDGEHADSREVADDFLGAKRLLTERVTPRSRLAYFHDSSISDGAWD